MVRKARRRAEWRRLVAEFEASDVSLTEFAEQNELGASTLRWWRSRLRRTEPQEQEAATALVPFVRVAVAGSLDETTAVGADRSQVAGPAFELPRGLVVRFPAEVEADYVAAVVAGTATRLAEGEARC